jgi:hypothetical protein
MTNSSNPNPDRNSVTNRRRRLTADELIAVIVALTGIGSILFWGLGQKSNPVNLLSGNTTAINGQNRTQPVGLLDFNNQAKVAVEGQKITPGKVKVKTPQGNTQVQVNGNVAVQPNSAANVNPAIIGGIAAAPIIAGANAPATVTTETPATEASPSPVAKVPEFKDVPKTFWGGDYISELQKRGILDDFGGGTFDPNKPITRGEYAKMLDRAFANRRVEERQVAFKDIPTDYPRKEAIDNSVKLGFMSGYSADKFVPNEQIPRYQMQISLAKGLNLPIPANVDGTLSKFTDAKEMPKYAREKMAAAIAAGLVVKDEQPNDLKPVKKATRADAAALVYESLVKEGVIQPQTNP